jgi:hypothetical protein
VVDACTNADDTAVYEALTFTDGKGETTTGTEAASAIASECVRGSVSSVPAIPPAEACGTILQGLLGCALAVPPSCTDEQIDELATCVEDCTQDTIAGITGGDMLTDDCIGCYGASVSCGAAACATECVDDTTSDGCVQCRCNAGCTPAFDVCSGFSLGVCD